MAKYVLLTLEAFAKKLKAGEYNSLAGARRAAGRIRWSAEDKKKAHQFIDYYFAGEGTKTAESDRIRAGLLLYTLVRRVADKAGKPVISFLPGRMKEAFYGMSRGCSLGPVSLSALEKVVPNLQAWIAPSTSRCSPARLTPRGEQLFRKLQAEGKLLEPQPGKKPLPKKNIQTKAAVQAEPFANFDQSEKSPKVETSEVFDLCTLGMQLAREPNAQRYLEFMQLIAQCGRFNDNVTFFKTAVEAIHGS